MNIASLALASALAALVGSAQMAAAQTQDQTGAATVGRAAPDDNATTGSANADRRDDEDARNPAASGRTNDGAAERPWRQRGPMVMRMRPMMPQRQMMRGAGAHFHFARGKARIDVTCSPQEDTEACVRAAGELIDKIAELRRGGDRDTMSGSDGRDDERSGAQSEDRDDSGAPGERM